ncbi:uncharacterized protein PHALS_01648 [Plasmopara halstedii]|uniref:Uncharacterized protein n=1 Tax=Plasmopara halstedii TaxID=4781 RepID=A0A0P1AVU9_PLAHL|nr:uncharacterized protein PHALS_01648 [Plasmopara halstedii]CEG45344.1 hypothetical protein PHALS_01648 [Plasmopara halstedii]|eukprot:XP_024581713.1 hypothetical protein PHALS_01648 [Plasmopara halstedii]
MKCGIRMHSALACNERILEQTRLCYTDSADIVQSAGLARCGDDYTHQAALAFFSSMKRSAKGNYIMAL